MTGGARTKRRVAVWVAVAATLLPVAMIAAALVSGCSTVAGDNSGEAAATATLWVTKNFGRDIVVEEDVSVSDGQTVMDVLRQNADVETAYGGGFVEAINEIRSGHSQGDQQDWFYYVNGMISETGAADTDVAPGDLIWWDYRDWSSSFFVPELVGAFPHPFAGKNSTGSQILYAEGFKEDAQKLRGLLEGRGARDLVVEALADRTAAPKVPTLVIGAWTQIDSVPWISRINRDGREVGLYATIDRTGDSVVIGAYNEQGKRVTEYEADCGLIEATTADGNPRNPLWLVTGTDMESSKRAAGALLDGGDRLKMSYAALVVDGRVISLPLSEESE